MAPARYKSGERFTMKFPITNKSTGASVDPATATLKLKSPADGAVLTFQWPVPGDVLIRVSQGLFQFEYQLVPQGAWERRLETDIGCVLEDTFIIDQSPFQ
jgi:hypothetical protein